MANDLGEIENSLKRIHRLANEAWLQLNALSDVNIEQGAIPAGRTATKQFGGGSTSAKTTLAPTTTPAMHTAHSRADARQNEQTRTGQLEAFKMKREYREYTQRISGAGEIIGGIMTGDATKVGRGLREYRQLFTKSKSNLLRGGAEKLFTATFLASTIQQGIGLTKSRLQQMRAELSIQGELGVSLNQFQDVTGFRSNNTTGKVLLEKMVDIEEKKLGWFDRTLNNSLPNRSIVRDAVEATQEFFGIDLMTSKAELNQRASEEYSRKIEQVSKDIGEGFKALELGRIITGRDLLRKANEGIPGVPVAQFWRRASAIYSMFESGRVATRRYAAAQINHAGMRTGD